MRKTNAMYLKRQRLIAETDTHKETHRDKLKDTQRDPHRHIHRHTQRNTHKETHTQTHTKFKGLPFLMLHMSLNKLMLRKYSNIVPTQFI